MHNNGESAVVSIVALKSTIKKKKSGPFVRHNYCLGTVMNWCMAVWQTKMWINVVMINDHPLGCPDGEDFRELNGTSDDIGGMSVLFFCVCCFLSLFTIVCCCGIDYR